MLLELLRIAVEEARLTGKMESDRSNTPPEIKQKLVVKQAMNQHYLYFLGAESIPIACLQRL